MRSRFRLPCKIPIQVAVLLVYTALAAPWLSEAQLAAEPSFSRGNAAAAGVSPERLAAIDALLESAVEKRQIAGGAVLVARHGKIVYLSMAGMQDAEAGAPIDEATIYRIASMTKPITTVAALMLVEEGKLRLDDPLEKYVPEFRGTVVLHNDAQGDQPLSAIASPAARPITIQHLLTHTSGLCYGFFDRPVLGKLYRQAGVSDGLAETPDTMGDNVRRLARVPLLFQPGEGWEYGLSTDVLGHVVGVVSGQTLDEFFRERIFLPLKMHDTHFILPAEKERRLAALYHPDESKQIRRVGSEPQQFGALRFSATYPLAEGRSYFSGGAGLSSTIGDYARFLQMLLNGGELDGVRLLRPETVQAMTRNQIGEQDIWVRAHGDKFGYGFGIVTVNRDKEEVATVGAYSWGGLFNTWFLVDPDKELLAILMMQIYPNDHLALHLDVKRLLYEAIDTN